MENDTNLVDLWSTTNRDRFLHRSTIHQGNRFNYYYQDIPRLIVYFKHFRISYTYILRKLFSSIKIFLKIRFKVIDLININLSLKNIFTYDTLRKYKHNTFRKLFSLLDWNFSKTNHLETFQNPSRRNFLRAGVHVIRSFKCHANLSSLETWLAQHASALNNPSPRMDSGINRRNFVVRRYPTQVQYQPKAQYQPQYQPQYRSQYQPQYQEQQQRAAYPAAPVQSGIQGRPAPNVDPNAGLASYTVNYRR